MRLQKLWLAVVVLTAGITTLTEGITAPLPTKVVVAAKHSIPAGAIVKGDDISEHIISAPKTPSDTVACRDLAIGHKTIYPIQQGQIIVSTHLAGDTTAKGRFTHRDCPPLNFWQAKKTIDARTIIKRDDLILRQIKVDKADASWVSGDSTVAESQTRCDIPKGAMIRGEMLNFTIRDSRKPISKTH